MKPYSLDKFLSMVFPSEAIKQHGFILVPVRDTDFFDLDEDKKSFTSQWRWTNLLTIDAFKILNGCIVVFKELEYLFSYDEKEGVTKFEIL